MEVSGTPAVLRDLRTPAMRAEMIFSFQRAWRMPMRRGEPGRWVRKGSER